MLEDNKTGAKPKVHDPAKSARRPAEIGKLVMMTAPPFYFEEENEPHESNRFDTVVEKDDKLRTILYVSTEPLRGKVDTHSGSEEARSQVLRYLVEKYK